MANGHRGRIRDRFEEENIDTIPEVYVLERIIHNVVVRRDAGEVSRNLIEKFGSFAKIVDAPKSELLKVDGIGPAAATFLKTMPAFYRKYRLSKWNDRKIFSDAESIMAYMQDKLAGYTYEVLAVMCLDSKFRLIACKTLFEGSVHGVDVNIRKILDFAINTNAERAIIAHNHPNSDLIASVEDRHTTHSIYNALHYAGVRLDDHIIVNDSGAISLAREKWFPTEPTVI